MAIRLKLKNPLVNQEERTYITVDYSSGTTLYVKNNDGFTTNWYVIVGEPGQEQSEIQRISSTTSVNQIVLASALNFSHSKNTPVYLTQFNQVSVERSTTESGTYATITNSPFNIEPDNRDLVTNVYDGSGSSSYYYKWRFYNSTTGAYSSYSGILAGSGVAVNTVGYALKEVKKNPVAREIQDDTILLYFHDFDELVYEKMPKSPWFTKEGTAVATVASDYTYPIDSNWTDYVTMRYLLYVYVNGSTTTTYPLQYKPLLEFYNLKADSTQGTSDTVTCYTILPGDATSLKGYIGLHTTPKTATCYIKPVYEKEPTTYSTFSDKLLIPRVKGYVDYALYRIYDEIVRDSTNADKYNARVAASIEGLKVRARKQVGEYTMMRYRGQKGFGNMFGGQGYHDGDYYRENYF